MDDDGASTASITMDQFFDAHYMPLQRFAYRRLLDYDLAEEIAVDCLVVAWKHGAPEAITRQWLFAVARNRIGDAIRRRDLDRRPISAVGNELKVGASLDGSGLIADALAKLSAADRELLTLLYWDDLTASEIAELLSTRVSAIWKRTTRAHDRLRSILQEARARATRHDDPARDVGSDVIGRPAAAGP